MGARLSAEITAEEEKKRAEEAKAEESRFRVESAAEKENKRVEEAKVEEEERIVDKKLERPGSSSSEADEYVKAELEKNAAEKVAWFRAQLVHKSENEFVNDHENQVGDSEGGVFEA